MGTLKYLNTEEDNNIVEQTENNSSTPVEKEEPKNVERSETEE